jgi:hypothetical protein
MAEATCFICLPVNRGGREDDIEVLQRSALEVSECVSLSMLEKMVED